MRKSCKLCVIKHLVQAHILFGEAIYRYPDHSFLAIGHLSEAIDECSLWPDIALEIDLLKEMFQEVLPLNSRTKNQTESPDILSLKEAYEKFDILYFIKTVREGVLK